MLDRCQPVWSDGGLYTSAEADVYGKGQPISGLAASLEAGMGDRGRWNGPVVTHLLSRTRRLAPNFSFLSYLSIRSSYLRSPLFSIHFRSLWSLHCLVSSNRFIYSFMLRAQPSLILYPWFPSTLLFSLTSL
jgi:hypothetical protein